MPTLLSPTVHNGGILPSNTSDFKKRNDCEIVFQRQKTTTFQDAFHVELDVMKIHQAATTYCALLIPDSGKAPAKSISRRKNEAGVNVIKIKTGFDSPHMDTSSPRIRRKQNKRSHLGQITDETSTVIVSTPSSAVDISLLSVFLRSSQVKRIRQTSSALWKLPTAGDINIEFSDQQRILPAPKGQRGYASRQDTEPEQASRSQSIVTCESDRLQTARKKTGEFLHSESRINPWSHTDSKREADRGGFPWDMLDSASPHGDLNEVDAIPKSLLKIMPFELLQHLEEDGRRCTAWTMRGTRCKLHHPIGSISAQLQVLLTFKPSALLPVIRHLIEVVFCASHQKVALKVIQLWKEEFEEVSKILDYESMFPMKNKRSWPLIRWICLLKRTALSQTILPSVLQHTVGNIVQEETLPVNPIQEFSPYVSKGLSGRISKELAKLLTKPLSQSDLKYQGSMYIFWQPGNFGHLKIGRSVNVPLRLGQWNKQCKKSMEIHFPEPARKEDEKMVDSQQVPHISRVEALVHLELMSHRRIEKRCPGCFKSHVEWFEVPKNVAIGIVRKWSAWMMTMPYEKQMEDGKEQWILKSTEREDLNNLCRTRTSFSTPSLPAAKEKNRSSPRLRHSI